MKKLFYKIELKIKDRYLGDGIIRVDEDCFEGFIAFDYFYGIYVNNYLCMLLMQYDYLTQEIYQSQFAIKMEDFELPNTFSIYGKDTEAHFNFKGKSVVTENFFSERLFEVKKIFFEDPN